MLKDYPMYFEDTKILMPTSMSESFKKVQNTAVTEAGHDSVVDVRVRKFEGSYEFYVTDSWAAIFEEFSWRQQFVLTRYDQHLGSTEQIMVRMEDFKIDLLKGSERIRVSNGLYCVSFKLVQF